MEVLSEHMKELRVKIERCDDTSLLHRIRNYTGGPGTPKVIGHQTQDPNWKQAMYAKIESKQPMDVTANLSFHRRLRRETRGGMEVLLPEPTMGKDRLYYRKRKSLQMTEDMQISGYLERRKSRLSDHSNTNQPIVCVKEEV